MTEPKRAWDAVLSETKERLANPVVGDRFQEHYTYFIYVLAVDDTHVTIADTVGCEASYAARMKAKGKSLVGDTTRCEVPDDLRLVKMTREELVENRSGVVYLDTVALHSIEGWLEVLQGKEPPPKEKLPDPTYYEAKRKLMLDVANAKTGQAIHAVLLKALDTFQLYL